MKEYDLIVIGSGAGLNLASPAFESGMRVAIVENGPMGGTCLNRGCIPTKILTYVADMIVQTQQAEKLNIKARVESVDFPALMERMREHVGSDARSIGEAINSTEGYDWYHTTGEFVDDYTLKVGDERIKGTHIFIAAGTRPLIPKIKGLDKVDFMTSKEALELTEQPKAMIILGGGYIAAEFGHFFSAVGTDVAIIGRNKYLVKNEDPDVSKLLEKELSKRMKVLTNHEAIEVNEKNGMKTVIAQNQETGENLEFSAESILVAVGRRSNADLFKPEKTGVKTDKNGYIIVDEYFRTSKKRIWAFGDAIGKYMFRHIANEESQIVWYNWTRSLQGGKEEDFISMDYDTVPWAVFSYPPIATVGLTLEKAKESGRQLLVGQANYSDVAKGFAMGDPEAFARIIADATTREILGATIIGPYAPMLIHEVIALMHTRDRSYVPALRAIHIHPALSEVVQRAFGRLAPLSGGHEHHHH
ncbi:MAG: dihydrolipoyl dehydrogenase [Candidatus Thorarchaeota archaeon]|nr:dihydrolipoyl dehydrogenase [Candidatus Thorarchaeota archaeon]